MKIITISGLDGSGKSTQIQMLKDHLESQGKRVFYFHAIEFGIAGKINNLKKYCMICRLFGKCKVKDKREDSVTKDNWLFIQGRKIFLKIDIWRFSLLCNKLRNSGFDYILSDRYFYDSIVNIEYLSGQALRARQDLPGHSDGLLEPAEPTLSIYLKVDPETIMHRERKPDQGIEYLKKKKELYDRKSSEWNWKVIDGNRNKEEIFEEIKNYVKISG